MLNFHESRMNNVIEPSNI